MLYQCKSTSALTASQLLKLCLANGLLLEPITTFRLGAHRNIRFTAVDKRQLVKWLFGSLLACSVVSERPVAGSFIKRRQPSQKMTTEKVAWLTTQRAGPRLTLQHWLSPAALVIITSLTEKWEEAGYRMALELRQSGRGKSGWWLSGARRDATVQQGGGEEVAWIQVNLLLLFFFFPSCNCWALICHSQTICMLGNIGLAHISWRQLSKLHCCPDQSV